VTDIDIEWEDVEKKVEEDEFKKEKKAEYDKQQKEQKTEEKEEQEKPEAQVQKYEPIGLSSLGSEVWNEVAVEKGYEAVSDKQSEFLQKHTARLEEKYLKDRMNMLPEIEAGLAHVVVYLPKWLKHRKEAKGDTK